MVKFKELFVKLAEQAAVTVADNDKLELAVFIA
jgi:hypothetical protein